MPRSTQEWRSSTIRSRADPSASSIQVSSAARHMWPGRFRFRLSRIPARQTQENEGKTTFNEGMVGPEEGPEPLKTLQNSWAKRRWFPAMFRFCPRAPVGKRPPITPPYKPESPPASRPSRRAARLAPMACLIYPGDRKRASAARYGRNKKSPPRREAKGGTVGRGPPGEVCLARAGRK
ncbi:hypothetical protein FB005_10395 [Sinorhizobium medicae]|nr:hypothetical protein FB006_102356 [Sinorhizobium medicae]TWA46950.1 hypothetical protein FB005_10395 [Sinorhizobium medicae]